MAVDILDGKAPRWKLVYFPRSNGRLVRREKLIWDPRRQEVRDVLSALEDRGVKAHVVCRRFPHFPPKGVPEDPTMTWCPYCRRWRWFTVPRPTKQSRVYHDLGLRCCPWCRITEEDAYVKDYNGTWRGRPKRKRKKRRRK